MTKTLTTRRALSLLLSLVSAILLFLLLAPTASAKTYTISGTGTKTKTLTIPKGCYQATLSWQNNGKEIISVDIGDTKKSSTASYGSAYYTAKKDKVSSGFLSPKKQKYKFYVTAAKKAKWTITLKPIKATTKLTLSGKGNKAAYVKVSKGTYKLSYTYSNNRSKGNSNFAAMFIDENIYTKMMQSTIYDELDCDEAMELFAKAWDSTVMGSKTSGKGTKTIIVEKDSYYLFEIQALIADLETGTLKPNHNVKWSFKLTPVKDK